MPEEAKGSTGSAFINKETGKMLIPIDINKIKDTGSLWGVIAEEISHIQDGLAGRQDKKVANDTSNKEQGLESLGRPINDYVKNKLGDNSSDIKLSTDGIDLTNADVGEKVGDASSPEDLKFKKHYREEVLPYNESYQNFLNTTLSMGLDASPLGVAKGITEAILGYDTITGEKLDLVTRTMGIFPIADDIYKNSRRGIKFLKSVDEVEAVLADGSKVILNIDDTIKNTNNTQKIASSSSILIPKVEVETPKIKPVENIIGTKTGNKKLNNTINTRGIEYYLDLRAQRVTAPIDFDGHIINGEINASGKAVGGHSTAGVNNNVKIDRLYSVSSNGVRTADISIFDSNTNQWVQKVKRNGTPQRTTLFPESWTESRIKVEVDIAYKNRITSQTRFNMWEGITPSGIRVEGYILSNTTVYPLP